MKHLTRQLILTILYPMLSVAIALLLWSIVALMYDRPLLLPQVDAVVKSLFDLLGKNSTYIAVLSTVARTLICYGLAIVISALLAIGSEMSSVFRRLLSPLLTIMATAPTVAIILIIIVFFSPTISPIVVCALVVIPVIYRLIVQEFDHNKPQMQMLLLYSVGKPRIIKYLYLPIIGRIFSQTADTTLPLALKVVVSAEVLVFTANSIGMGLYSSRLDIDIARLFAWTLICVIVCFAIQGISLLCKYCYRRAKLCRFN